MKTRVAVAVLAVLVSALAIAPSIQAQAFEPAVARIRVPFAFEFGPHHYEPGTYDLRLLDEHVITLSGRSAIASAMYTSESNRKNMARGHVTFHKYGNHYFLDELWPTGSAEHIILYVSKQEERAALEAASQKVTPIELATAKFKSSSSER